MNRFLKILTYLICAIGFLFSCNGSKLSKVYTAENEIIINCGLDISQNISSYNFYQFFIGSELLETSDLKVGRVGNPKKTEDKKFIITNSCIGLKKNSVEEFYIYTKEKTIKYATILKATPLNQLSNIQLSSFNENPKHFEACGYSGQEKNTNKNIYGLKISLHENYPNKDDIESFDITLSGPNKKTNNLKLNKYNCIFIDEEQVEDVIEIKKKDSEEILYRRPINIWESMEDFKNMETSQITMCSDGGYYDGKECLVHFLYYCNQKPSINIKLKNLISKLAFGNTDLTCNQLLSDLESSETIIQTDIDVPINIEPLFNLTHLNEITLTYGSIKDISSLKNMLELTNLNLSYNLIEDTTHLKNLTELIDLDFSYNRITHLTEVSKLPKLNNLNIGGNSLLNSIESLSAIPELTSLDISYCPLINITKINNLDKLILLNLKGVDVNHQDITAFPTLLEYLDLEKTNIKNISLISKLPNLRSINLSNNGLNSIDFLLEFKSINLIENIILNKNKIKDISPLGKFNKIIYLDLYKNEIEDISKLKDLINLKKLYLGANKIDRKNKEKCPINGTSETVKKYCSISL